MTSKRDKLYYLGKFEDGHDLWMHDFKKDETKKVLKISEHSSDISITKNGKFIFLHSDSKFIRIATADNKRKNITIKLK